MRLLWLFPLLVLACTRPTPEASTSAAADRPGAAVYERLSNEAFAKVRATYPDAPLLDVRTPEEYASGHLKDAENLPVNHPDFLKRASGYDKTAPVLVYCQKGGRSARACEALREAGFRQVYELERGYGDWE